MFSKHVERINLTSLRMGIRQTKREVPEYGRATNETECGINETAAKIICTGFCSVTCENSYHYETNHNALRDHTDDRISAVVSAQKGLDEGRG